MGRIYKFAARRLAFTGMNPIALMLSSERPKVSQATRRPMFTPEQIEQTIAAANEPYRTLFTVAALGTRVSELCGLTWANVCLDDWTTRRSRSPGRSTERGIAGQLRRTVLPGLCPSRASWRWFSRGTSSLHATWALRRLSSPLAQGARCRSGTSPALRKAQQRASDERGQPTSPVLHGGAEVPAGAVLSMHSFRHTVASRALLAGESVDEVVFLLGHRDATVTRVVYIHEIADARRRHMRRSRMTAEYAGALRIALQDRADGLTPYRRAANGQQIAWRLRSSFRGGALFVPGFQIASIGRPSKPRDERPQNKKPVICR
jgi:integrase